MCSNIENIQTGSILKTSLIYVKNWLDNDLSTILNNRLKTSLIYFKTGLTRSQQDMSAIWIIKSNRSQNQSDRFDSASWLVLRQVFVLSLYKRDITRLVGRYVHSTATHTSLLKTHVIFNNKTHKTIKQYICIILFSLSISLTFTYTTCISLNHSKPPIYLHASYLIIIAH